MARWSALLALGFLIKVAVAVSEVSWIIVLLVVLARSDILIEVCRC